MGLSTWTGLSTYKFFGSEEETGCSDCPERNVPVQLLPVQVWPTSGQNGQLGVTALSLAFFTESSGRVPRCDGFSCAPLPLQQKSRLQRAHPAVWHPRPPGSSRPVWCHQAITKLTKSVDEQEQLQQDHVGLVQLWAHKVEELVGAWGVCGTSHLRYESLTANFQENSIITCRVETPRHPTPLPSRESVYSDWSAGSPCIIKSRNSTHIAGSMCDAALEGTPANSSMPVMWYP